MDLVDVCPLRQRGHELTYERSVQHGKFGGGEEKDDFRIWVDQLIVGDQTHNVRDLVSGRREDSGVLWNVHVRIGLVLRNTVDDLVVWLQRLLGDLSNLLGNCSREEERLTGFRQVVDDKVEIVGETHLEQCIGFVKDQHVGFSHSIRDVGFGKEIAQSTRSGHDDILASSSPVTQLKRSRHSTDEKTHLHLLVPGANFQSFVGDLRGELTSGRDDECSDVGAGNSAKVLALLRPVRDVSILICFLFQLVELVLSRINGRNKKGLLSDGSRGGFGNVYMCGYK